MSTKGGLSFGSDVARFVENPQPGDYFTDHLSPVCFIEAREPHSVYVRKPDHANGVWGEAQWMLLPDFTKWLSYGSASGYWVERRSVPKWIGQLADDPAQEGEKQ